MIFHRQDILPSETWLLQLAKKVRSLCFLHENVVVQFTSQGQQNGALWQVQGARADLSTPKGKEGMKEVASGSKQRTRRL